MSRRSVSTDPMLWEALEEVRRQDEHAAAAREAEALRVVPLSPARRIEEAIRACAANRIPARNYTRLRGETIEELQADAQALARELGLA